MHFSYDALRRYLIYIPPQGHVVDIRNNDDIVQKVHYQTPASRKLKNKIGKWNKISFRKQRGV